MPDINADDVFGAGLQQAVGEASSRLSDVEAGLAAGGQPGMGQGAGQLVAAA